MGSRVAIGREAERLALLFLLDRGLHLLERNWRVGHYEIDLIMRSGNLQQNSGVVHIVEVRSLSSSRLQRPIETVGQKKRNSLISAASSYLLRNSIDSPVQFDIVSVLFGDTTEPEIEYFPDAFAPEW